ncbi:zf-HC2 domain-containing protein [Micromonospora sp. LOL_023]|uniref:zf-HC2 domain-containing protein n=1 Tax=Micromonospora sp. LOL_023 TaxID=3345418 RepID=UPI003A8C4B9D
MADGGCGEPQLRDALGLYQVGALPDDELTAVELHLAICGDCLAEASRVGEAVMMLALLSEADRDDLIAEFGAAAGAPAQPAVPVPPVDPLPVAGPVSAAGRVDRATRPTGSAGGAVRPRRGPRRQRRLVLAGVGLAVALFLIAGVTGGQPMLAWLFGADASTTLVANANATDASTGATLSVAVTAHGDGLGLRAAINGLTVGAPYRFYVTDIDGRSWELAAVTGTGRPQEVETSCPVPIDRLARFSVTARDGSLAVMAPVELQQSSAGPG